MQAERAMPFEGTTKTEQAISYESTEQVKRAVGCDVNQLF
jgi:hypothetical protein